MVNQINDIGLQASQGSIAAIIQILNEKLANSGVRTRAVFNNGILQLLCEAQTKEKLEKSTLVQQIKQILESIEPRNVHKVKINSRIVREQQLLWLEEINRDPENQLLWSELITLKRPNIVKQIVKSLKDGKTQSKKIQLSQAPSSFNLITDKNTKVGNSFFKRISNAFVLSLLMLSTGWVAYYFLGKRVSKPIDISSFKSLISNSSKTKSLETPDVTHNQLRKPIVSNFPNSSRITPQAENDIFAVAVRIANQASEDGKTKKTSAEWLDLAAKWQRASDLMAEVPSSHSRFQEAKERVGLYKKYSESALKEANKK